MSQKEGFTLISIYPIKNMAWKKMQETMKGGEQYDLSREP